ncbi:alpha/beta hydrolase [Marinomonas agarivorans]|nr:alpha/beta hydrolase [Marinomonas agarivorans]
MHMAIKCQKGKCQKGKCQKSKRPEEQERRYALDHTTLAANCFHHNEKEGTEQVVLALHGWLDNADSFAELRKYLPHYSWVCVDLSGHGNSEHRADNCFYHIWDYVRDIVQLIKQLNTNVSLVGHSLGGAVAMLVVSVIPESVQQLIMLDNVGPFTAQPTERITKIQGFIRSADRVQNKKKRLYETQEDMIAARMKGFTSLSRQAASALVMRGSQLKSGSGYHWKHDAKLEVTSPFAMDAASVDEFAKNIMCPVLILLAENGIYQTNKPLVAHRGKHISDLDMIWLPGNHHFHLEAQTAGAVANKVGDFLHKNR